jgi:DNA-binding transcriptional LysR family regulator
MAIFAHVVELQSFSAAANTLGLSKSAVSKQVSEMENALGVRLLSRSTRRLSLTAAGELFYASCARVISEATAAEQSIGDLRSKPAGRLRINAPIEIGCRKVAPILAEFLLRYPAVRAELTLQDDVVDVVSEGIDIALRIGKLADSALVSRRIGPVQMYLVAAPAYLERRGRPESHTDLRDHDFLIYSLPENPRRLMLKKNGHRYRVTVDGPLSCNSGRAHREAALAGLGIAALPDFYLDDDIESGRLVPVLADYELPDIALHAVFPPGRSPTASQRLFLDLLVERLGRCETTRHQ